MSHTPYYYAPGGKYVLFLDLLGFTAFVRSSFQKKAKETDDREKEFELAQKQLKTAQAEVDREYRRFHEHLEEVLRRPVRRGKSPAMSLVFSDCAYVVFDRPQDAERFAVHAMRSFLLNDMPVRMGLSYGSFTNYEFKTGVLPNPHQMFAAPFMGTAVVDSYRAWSSGIKGMRILVHPSFFLSAPDLDDFLVPLPKSEQRTKAVGELNWYDLDLRLTLRRHIRRMKKSAPARVVPEHDLDMDHDTLDHLRDEGLVEIVNLGYDERGRTLTREGRDLLDSHSLDRDGEPSQAFYAGVSREREIDHDSNLYATYRQEEARLRDEHDGLEIRRVVLEQDLKREYQEFLQEHNRGRADSDGRPDRDEHEIRDWGREHDLPYFDGTEAARVQVRDGRGDSDVKGAGRADSGD